jgi:hypothetical protein
VKPLRDDVQSSGTRFRAERPTPQRPTPHDQHHNAAEADVCMFAGVQGRAECLNRQLRIGAPRKGRATSFRIVNIGSHPSRPLGWNHRECNEPTASTADHLPLSLPKQPRPPTPIRNSPLAPYPFFYSQTAQRTRATPARSTTRTSGSNSKFDLSISHLSPPPVP